MSKHVEFVGDSLDRLKEFPAETQVVMGQAIREAQEGRKAIYATPLRGLGGGAATVMEIRDNYAGDTYRVMYTVKIGIKIFILHAFQKKSKTGKETPKPELEVIKIRLQWAKELAKDSEPLTNR